MSDFYDEEKDLFIENVDEEEKKEEPEKGPDDSDYEDVCFVCRRPESKAGRMFHLPGHTCKAC